ncbi:hypothetical protein [Oricola cellulosilytica]|uniref:Uncharacterized protein n=1 Tax=Oricola cellulosilytica TaxID=1429082 RepID=A0A4R0PDS5_9HYPH|nr:hypothetical protein [Oricola cellulosilytica]TCD14479.1 hypothetical protein E0D97_10495 [Oricola cellulosilytica]
MAELQQPDLDRLEYIAGMLAELRGMAEEGQLPSISYYLGMAQMDALELLDRLTELDSRDERNAVA